MRIKWQWRLEKQDWIWLFIVSFIAIAIECVFLFVVDPLKISYFKTQDLDTSSIKVISEKYINDCGIQINKPIKYEFVSYPKNKKAVNPEDIITLGSFHEWNNTYYITISVDLYKSFMLESVVIHETRHMIVEYLKDKDIIDLTKYTEEIAQGQTTYYNDLFDDSVNLFKKLELEQED